MRQNTIERAQTDCYRLVHGESDYLPGLTVDRYGAHLVLQAGTLGIDQRKAQLARQLMEITGCAGVVERSDDPNRRKEGLALASGLLVGEAPPDKLIVSEPGRHGRPLRFQVDLLGGQKTGFYLDQSENRRRAAAFCTGQRVLNAFSYTGAFAIHALAAGGPCGQSGCQRRGAGIGRGQFAAQRF
ncbi:MAG: class I SAM-dependent methyltransferase [Caldilineaceae bacterium]